MDILLLRIIAMVCGAEFVEDIACFGETHIRWLKNHLVLPNNIPDNHFTVIGPNGPQKVRGKFSLPDRGILQRIGNGSMLLTTMSSYLPSCSIFNTVALTVPPCRAQAFKHSPRITRIFTD